MTAQMFSTREVPWMKLGKLADSAVTAREAAAMSGLDFIVEKRKAGYINQNGNWKVTPGVFAIVRNDTDESFGYVGKDYEMLQYGDAFNFMDTIEPNYVAAGPLQGGKQGFMVTKPDLTINPGGDPIELFLMLRTSHDRSRAVEISVMPLRGLCMNMLTLRSMTKNAEHRWAIRHNGTMRSKMHEAQGALLKLRAYGDELDREIEQLLAITPSVTHAKDIVERHIVGGGEKRDEVVTTILDLWQNDDTTVGFNGTGWGLVNACSEYYDWLRPRYQAEARFRNALDGVTHRVINQIASTLLHT